MEQNSGAMNSGSMLKQGDQPRATERSVSEARAPASMSYVRYGFNKGAPRSNSYRNSRG